MDYLQYTKEPVHLVPIIPTIVLNLVINGLPSIPRLTFHADLTCPNLSFKPCYKWITFNTLRYTAYTTNKKRRFKPCYKWITFNTNQNTVDL